MSYYPFITLAELRKKLEGDHRRIQITDLGAGSRIHKGNERSVSEILKTSVKEPKYAELLFRLVQNRNDLQSVLELGTSLGVTTAYLAKANEKAAITTLEGCPEIAKIAEENFKQLGLTNVRLEVGNFDHLLPEIIKEGATFDLVYIDGNHRKAPTLQYFNQLKEVMNPKGIMIFDDIHWSKEMYEAWKEIKNNPQIQCTVDLYQLGIVFLDSDFEGHYAVKY